jgi:hypothetical protein
MARNQRRPGGMLLRCGKTFLVVSFHSPLVVSHSLIVQCPQFTIITQVRDSMHRERLREKHGSTAALLQAVGSTEQNADTDEACARAHSEAVEVTRLIVVVHTQRIIGSAVL